MKVRLLSLFAFAAISLKSSASAEVNFVDAENRSKGFEAVATKLDLGGDLYSYIDTEGYIEQIAKLLSEFVQGMQVMTVAQGGALNPAMAFANQFEVYGEHLGLFNIEAVGASAYFKNEKFHCKTYLYQPEGRAGLFTLIGDEPHEFELLQHAPADTDYFYSCDLSLNRLEPILRNIAIDVMGEIGVAMLDQALERPLPEIDLTSGDLLASLDTEIALIMSLGEGQSLPEALADIPEFEIPQINATVMMRNLAPLIDKLMQAPGWQEQVTVTKSGSVTFYTFPEYETTLPFGEGAGFFATDSETGFAYLSTSVTHYDACIAKSNGLAQSASFKVATTDLPLRGNAFNYTSSDIYKVVSDLMETAKTAIPGEASFALGFYEILFPMLGADGTEPPSASVALNEASGTWVIANSPFRPNSGAGSEAQVPVVVGLLAAMAIPAFNKVRATSREKAVTNNLRQYVSGGQQYMLEEGKDRATYEDIVGSGRYVRSLDSVNGEDYSELVVDSGGGTLTVVMDDGTIVSYDY